MKNRKASTGSKLGYGRGAGSRRVRGSASILIAGGTVAGLVLAACATTAAPPEPVSERLDPDTATTVTILTRPIELVSQNTARHIGDSDPFAYVAPFETNRMGARDLYLWVSTPQAQSSLTPPQVLCNGQPLNLQPLSSSDSGGHAEASPGPRFAPGNNVSPDPASGAPVKVDLSTLSLSRAPYDAPVPWGTQWYFRLPPESLKCLADAQGIAVKAKSQDGGPDQYETAERKELASLDAFTRR